MVKQEDAQTQSPMQRFLIVMVGGRPYGIDVDDVVEVVPVPQVTALPQSPDHVVGVFSHRASIIALSDLRTRFGCKPTKPADGCIVIVDVDDPQASERFRIGIMVDEVRDIIEFHHEDIQPPPSLGSIMSTAFLRGIGRTKDDAILLLDIGATITIENFEPLDGSYEEIDAFLQKYGNEADADRIEQAA